MSDLENMLNAENANAQPGEAVAADPEASKAEPHAEPTEEVEFYVEDEGDQVEQPKNDFDDVAKRRAAFAKAKQKEREAKKKAREMEEKLEQERKEREKLAAQLAELSKPTLENCDYDDEEYRRKLLEWEASKPKPSQQDTKKEAEYEPDIDAQFAFNEGDSKLKSGGIKDVEGKVSELADIIQTKFGVNPDSVFDSWAAIAEESGEDYDVSAARYMIARNPQALDAIARCRTPLGINRILKEHASKLKVRSHKKVETKPEPSINSSGPVDNSAAALQKARDAWVKAGPGEKMQAWNAYQALKKKVNNNG